MRITRDVELELRSLCCGSTYELSKDNSKTYICNECHRVCNATSQISDKAARNLMSYVNAYLTGKKK